MAHAINAGIEVSTGFTSDNVATSDPSQMVWYQLTDDNRQPIKIGYEVIEKTNRMADGTLRRYVIARKHKITSNWQNTFSRTTPTTGFPGTTDYSATDNKKGKAGAWIKSFYEANVFIPIYVRLTVASETTQNINTTDGFIPNEDTYVSSFNANGSTNMVYNVFMTNFDYEVVKRNVNYDLVNINIEFTEI